MSSEAKEMLENPHAKYTFNRQANEHLKLHINKCLILNEKCLKSMQSVI